MWRSAVQLCLGLPLIKKKGGLAQLARAPALQAGGQRFESVILHSRVFILKDGDCETIYDILDRNENVE